MNEQSITADARWQRILQSAMYPYDAARMIGGSIIVDPEVSQMNDIARLIELCSRPPFRVGVMLNADADLVPSPDQYWRCNVFEWDSRDPSTLVTPTLANENYVRYAEENILIVAPLKLTLVPTGSEETEPLSIWSYLIIDPVNNIVDRIDTHSALKPDLDAALTKLFEKFTYRSPDVTGAAYRNLVNGFTIPYEVPEFVHYNMWTYWLLFLRLSFSDYKQEDVYATLCQKLTGSTTGVMTGNVVGDISVGNLLINFYPAFTDDANEHVFGATDFVQRYGSKNDLWRYTSAAADSVYKLTTRQLRSTQLNQILGAAVRDYIALNNGADYIKLYNNWMGADPMFVPKGEDCGGWIPSSLLDSATRKILGGSELLLGYVSGIPFVYNDSSGKPIGFDVDLAAKVVSLINAKYGSKLAAKFIDAYPGAGDDVSATEKFTFLYNGMKDGKFHAAFSGMMVLPPSEVPQGMSPEWACSSAFIFTAVSFTGLDRAKFDPGKVSPPLKGRGELVDWLLRNVIEPLDIELSFFSVVNPGPSPGSAQDIVRAINDGRSPHAKGHAVWRSGDVAESGTVLSTPLVHFMVGDSTASGWQVKNLSKIAEYLNIAAVESPSIFYDETVHSATLLPVAPFTIKAG